MRVLIVFREFRIFIKFKFHFSFTSVHKSPSTSVPSSIKLKSEDLSGPEQCLHESYLINSQAPHCMPPQAFIAQHSWVEGRATIKCLRGPGSC